MFDYNLLFLLRHEPDLKLLEQLLFKSKQVFIRADLLCNQNTITHEKKTTDHVNKINATVAGSNIFIIHGHDEAKRRELKEIIKDDFHLNPIILDDMPNGGASTIIEKFEKYAPSCGFAFAIFTPDDKVVKDGDKEYFQTRPNVIFELGWFFAKLGRKNVVIILKEGTIIPSDLNGIIQLRFKNNVKELYKDIDKEFKQASIIK